MRGAVVRTDGPWPPLQDRTLTAAAAAAAGDGAGDEAEAEAQCDVSVNQVPPAAGLGRVAPLGWAGLPPAAPGRCWAADVGRHAGAARRAGHTLAGSARLGSAGLGWAGLGWAGWRGAVAWLGSGGARVLVGGRRGEWRRHCAECALPPPHLCMASSAGSALPPPVQGSAVPPPSSRICPAPLQVEPEKRAEAMRPAAGRGHAGTHGTRPAAPAML